VRWNHVRQFNNRLSAQDQGDNGNSWTTTDQPYITHDGLGSDPNLTTQILMMDGYNALWFDYSGGNYAARFFVEHTLTRDTTNKYFKVTTPAGEVFQFYDHSTSWAESLRGKLYYYSDPNGTLTYATYSSGKLASFVFGSGGTTQGYYYDYYSAGDNAGKLQYVTHKVNGTNVRRNAYTYYGTSESYGSVGDLKRDNQEQWNGSSWDDLGATYYRYYKSGDANGFTHGLKYLVDQEGYARLVAGGITPETADNTYIAGAATHYFEYDGSKRVTREKVHGGAYTYDFSYTASGFTDDPNKWKWKTIETLPGGNQMIVYTNYLGLPMLKVFVSGSDKWYEFWTYDAAGRPLLNAKSSAISGYDDTKADLLNKVSGNYQYLNDSTGLIWVKEYYTSTDVPNGAVNGRLRYLKVKQGETGTETKVKEYKYTSRTAGSITTYPLWKVTEYRSDASGGSDGVTTEYTYTWHGSTTAMNQKTTTWPAVLDTQHGSGSATSRVEVFDVYGQRLWLKDERGFIFRWKYDASTGALTQKIEDVNTSLVSDEPAGWTTPGGGGLHLITDYTSDGLGRITEERGPEHTIDVSGTATAIRRCTWWVYKDTLQQQLEGQGWQKVSDSSYTLINPVKITQLDRKGRTKDVIEAVRASTSGKLTASDTFAQTTWTRWRHWDYDTNDKLNNERLYHNIPSSGDGSSGTNYNQTDYGYTTRRWRNYVRTPGLTITRTVYHPKGWVKEVWVGTNDTGATESNPAGSGSPNNMKKVVSYEYDGNTVGGDGTLTNETRHVNDSTNRVTNYGYDFRGRRTSTDGEIDFYEAYTYDNQDRLTSVQQKNTTSGGTLVAQRDTAYDNLGRVYLQTNYSVSSGSTGNSLKEKIWRDATGNVIKVQKLGAKTYTFEKRQYDGVSRVTKSFVCYHVNEADTDYSAASTVTDDTVMSQTENTYDAASNLIQTTHRDRFHDATGTGELTTPGGSQPKARVTYVALYPDAIGRQQADADYGTNGASAFSRSSTIPSRSGSPTPQIIINSTVYDDAGMVWKVTGPESKEDRKEYDDAGRLTKTLENWVASPSTPDQNKETQFTYTADSKLATLTAVNSTTGNQTTTWTYGTTLTESDVASNDLVRYKQLPDGSVSDRLEGKYNRQGEIKEHKDQNGNIRTLEYDLLGRLQHDRVTTLGSGVDGTVRRITRSYEVRGLLEKLTSYDNATVGSGSVVNEIQYAYNGFMQLTTEYQSHSGAVNTGTSPKVQYAYADGSSSTIRRTQVTYPDATAIDYDYGTGSGNQDMLSVVKQLKNGATVLVDYSHLGVDRTVIANYSGQPGVELTYLKQSGDATLTGDRYPGDDYYGIDRFDRVQDQRWRKTSDNTDRERVKYGFDRAGNRVWRQNTVAGTGQDEYYTYDGLYQIKTLDRGTLTGTFPSFTGIGGTASWEEDWNFDATGNWRGSSSAYLTKVNGTTTLNQNRTHNVANEITAFSTTTGTAWPTPTHDANGNMTVAPRPLSLGNSYDLKYDAWNRLMEVKNTGGSTIATYRYDGAFRRVSAYDGTNTRHYYYSDQWQILEERLNSSSSADKRFVWGMRYIDDLILRDSGGTRHYVLHDYFNVTAIINTSGAVQERYGYDAFGAVRFMNSSFGSASSGYTWETLYGAYRYDSDTGLYQVRHRYLHPNTGRWLSRDPIGYRAGTNLYANNRNKPVNIVDPLGLMADCWPGYFPDPLAAVWFGEAPCPCSQLANDDSDEPNYDIMLEKPSDECPQGGLLGWICRQAMSGLNQEPGPAMFHTPGEQGYFFDPFSSHGFDGVLGASAGGFFDRVESQIGMIRVGIGIGAGGQSTTIGLFVDITL